MIDRPLLAKRLNAAYEYLRSQGVIHTITEFASALGKSQGDISSALVAKGRVMTTGLLKRVYDTFPDYFHEKWLLTGEGQMAKSLRELRPHIHTKAAAGFMAGISDGEFGDDIRPMIPGIPDYDFSITAYGKSMEPKIEDNDILACRIVTDSLNAPIGKICVIDSKEGAAVKVIKEVEEDSIVLHSLNPRYKDYRVSFSDLNRIAVVVGMIRNF